MISRSFGLAALLLVLAAAASRPVALEQRTACPSPGLVVDRVAEPGPSPALPPENVAPAAPLPVTEGRGPARRIDQDAEERLWARIRQRDGVMEATAAHLGWDERQTAVAWGAVRTIDDAWRIRDLDPSPFAQQTYEEVKRLALESVAGLLDGSSDRHRRFGERLEEWIDALR